MTSTIDVTTIDIDDVIALGNVDESLASFYADAIASAAAASGATQREIRDWVDDELISEQGFRTQALTGPGENGAAVLMALENAHVLRADSRRGAEWYELSHDRLVAPVIESNSAWRAANLSPLQLEAVAWQAQGRPESLLMSGTALAAAQAWADAHPQALAPDDADFLAASHDTEQRALAIARTRRRWRIAAIVVGVALLALGFFAYDAMRDRSSLQQARDEAEANALEAEANAVDATQQADQAEAARSDAEAARSEAEIAAGREREARETAIDERAAAEAARADAEKAAAVADEQRAEAVAARAEAEELRAIAEEKELNAFFAAVDANEQRQAAVASAAEADRQRQAANASAAEADRQRTAASGTKIARPFKAAGPCLPNVPKSAELRSRDSRGSPHSSRCPLRWRCRCRCTRASCDSECRGMHSIA